MDTDANARPVSENAVLLTLSAWAVVVLSLLKQA